MCWSYEVSLCTTSVVTATSIYLVFRHASRHDLGHALWLAFFGSMQLIDTLLWAEEHSNGLRHCTFSNQVVTHVGWMVIMLEPVVSLLSRMVVDREMRWKTLLAYFLCFFFAPHAARILMDCEWKYCAQLTEGGSLLLGIGVDRNGGISCWRSYFLVGASQSEIPLLLRVLWLFGIVYPFLSNSNPIGRGLLHSLIITVTWIVGYASSSHASVWCLANVTQSVAMVLDPYLFPPHRQGSPVERGKRANILQDPYIWKKVPDNLDAIVIGSGIGGLTTAAVMAKAGKKVLVLEQHYRAGGCTHTFDEFGDLFDSGIHYVGARDICDAVLGRIADVPIRWCEMGSLEDGWCYDVFDMGDGKPIRYRKGKDALIQELIDHFPHERDGIQSYFSHLFHSQMATYLFAFLKILPLRLANSFLGRWIIQVFLRLGAGRTSRDVVSEHVKDPKLQAILSGGQLIDWNLVPDRVSWWVVACMMRYYIDGAIYPEGGSQKIAEAIIPTIEKSGGRVLCGASVTEILFCNEKEARGRRRAAGVRLQNGDEFYAPVIISDAGAFNTFVKLVPTDELTKRNIDVSVLSRVPPSNGHMTAFISLDGPHSEFGLTAANIHSFRDLPKFNYDISEMQRHLYADQKTYRDGCLITLTCPSAKDSKYCEMRPHSSNVLMLAEGKYEWFSPMGPQRHSERCDAYKELKKDWESVFLSRLYDIYPKTKGHVQRVEIGTPLTTEHFLAADSGGSYGLEWTPERFKEEGCVTLFHPETPIDGLYLTGEASLFGGFCGALVSGIISAVHILGPIPVFSVLLRSDDVNALRT